MGIRTKARESATAWLAAALASAGTAAAVEPAIIDAVMQYLPDRWHGVAIALTGVAFAVARLRREIAEKMRKRNDIPPTFIGAMLALAVFSPGIVEAQQDHVIVEVDLEWTLPTTDTLGQPLEGERSAESAGVR